MVTRSQIEKLSKSIEALVSRLSPAADVRTVQCNYGEDEGLIQEAWRQQNAELPEPQNWVLISIFGAPPRPDLCTRESLQKALPHLKAFIAQGGDEPDAWRFLCRCFAIDYDATAARRPYAERE